jgi:hypothetical protein
MLSACGAGSCLPAALLVQAGGGWSSPADKRTALSAAGLWFLDSCQPQAGASSGVPACRPLHWRLPQAEAAHYSFPRAELGLVHGGEPVAAEAARVGVSGMQVEQHLDLIKDEDCWLLSDPHPIVSASESWIAWQRHHNANRPDA